MPHKKNLQPGSSPELLWPVTVWNFDKENTPSVIYPEFAVNEPKASSANALSYLTRTLHHVVSPKKGSKSPLIRSVSFSPDGNYLVSLDLSGNITISDAKKFVRVEYISNTTLGSFLRDIDAKMEEDRKELQKERPIEETTEIFDPTLSHISKVEWWDNTSLLLLRKNGELVIIGVLDQQKGKLRNLLGEYAERFAPNTVVSSVVDEQLFLLECKDNTYQIPLQVVRDDLSSKVTNAAKYVVLLVLF